MSAERPQRKDKSYYIASMQALLDQVPPQQPPPNPFRSNHSHPHAHFNHDSIQSHKSRRLLKAPRTIPPPSLTTTPVSDAENSSTMKSSTTPQLSPPITHQRSVESDSVKTPILHKSDSPDRLATPVPIDPVTLAPLVTPNIARVFRSKSAHLTSPMFNPSSFSSTESFYTTSRCTVPVVRANPTAPTPEQDALFPSQINPFLIATAVFHETDGFEENISVDVGYRARRVPIPYAVRVVYDGHSSRLPKSVKLTIDSQVPEGFLVSVVGPDAIFEKADEDDESVHDCYDAYVFFWAAPDAFGVRSCANLILNVDSGDTRYKTLISLSCEATEPLLVVQISSRAPTRKGKDTQVTFSEIQDFGAENVTVSNETKHGAPLLLSVFVAESGRGVFSVGRHIDEHTDCFPMCLYGGESFAFKVHYEANNAIRRLSTYFGTVLIKLASMYPQQLPYDLDGDLHFAYDHVIGLQANRPSDIASDTIEYGEHTAALRSEPQDLVKPQGNDSQIYEEHFDEDLVDSRLENRYERADDFTQENAQKLKLDGSAESASERESPQAKNSSNVDGTPIFAPLEVVLSPVGLDPVPEGQGDGPLYEGIFQLHEPIQWIERERVDDGSDTPSRQGETFSPTPPHTTNAAETQTDSIREASDPSPQLSGQRTSSSVTEIRQNVEMVDSNTVPQSLTEISEANDHLKSPDINDDQIEGRKMEEANSNATSPDKDFSDASQYQSLTDNTPFGKLMGYSPNKGVHKVTPEDIPQPNFFDEKQEEMSSKKSVRDDIPETQDNNMTCEEKAQNSGETVQGVDLSGSSPDKASSTQALTGNGAPDYSSVGIEASHNHEELAETEHAEEENAESEQNDCLEKLQSAHGIGNLEHHPEGNVTPIPVAKGKGDSNEAIPATYEDNNPEHIECTSHSEEIKSSLQPTATQELGEFSEMLVEQNPPIIAPTGLKPPVPRSTKASLTPLLSPTMPLPSDGPGQYRNRRNKDSMSSTSSMISAASTALTLGKLSLKGTFGKGVKPRLRMPRTVRKNGAILTSTNESVLLPLGNGSNQEIAVKLKIKKPRDSGASASLSSDFCVISPAGRIEVAITRSSAAGGSLSIILSCSFLQGSAAPVSYEVPLTIEPSPTIPTPLGFTIDRPTLTYYNPGRSNSRRCRVRVHNGTLESAQYKLWIGPKGRSPKNSDIDSVFRIASPSEGVVDAKKSLDIDVEFYSWQRMDHFYDDLNIKLNNQIQSIKLFGYTGGSDIKLRLNEKGYLYLKNEGDRFGFITLSQPELSDWDSFAMRIVIEPGEEDILELPHGSGTVIHTGDEIARRRLVLALEKNAEQQHGQFEEFSLFTDAAFEGEVRAKNREEYNFEKDESSTFYYASRLFAAETRRFVVDVRSNLVIPAEQAGKGRAGWRASYDGNGWVHIANDNPNENLEFQVDGADPPRGRIPALGDAKVAPYRERVVVSARQSNVELLSPVLSDNHQH